MTEASLKELSPGEKKVAAKTLYNMGWSSQKLERWLGISDDTILRAVNAPTPEALREFEADFEIAIRAEKKRGIALGVKRLNELIPKERRIEPLVKGLDYLEGRNMPAPTFAQQINIHGKITDEQLERIIE